MAIRTVLQTTSQEVELVCVEPGIDDCVEAPAHYCGVVERTAPGVTVKQGATVLTCVPVNAEQRVSEVGLEIGDKFVERVKKTIVAVDGDRDPAFIAEWRKLIANPGNLWGYLYHWSEAVSSGQADPQDMQWEITRRHRPPRPSDEDTAAPEGD